MPECLAQTSGSLTPDPAQGWQVKYQIVVSLKDRTACAYVVELFFVLRNSGGTAVATITNNQLQPLLEVELATGDLQAIKLDLGARINEIVGMVADWFAGNLA